MVLRRRQTQGNTQGQAQPQQEQEQEYLEPGDPRLVEARRKTRKRGQWGCGLTLAAAGAVVVLGSVMAVRTGIHVTRKAINPAYKQEALAREHLDKRHEAELQVKGYQELAKAKKTSKTAEEELERIKNLIDDKKFDEVLKSADKPDSRTAQQKAADEARKKRAVIEEKIRQLREKAKSELEAEQAKKELERIQKAVNEGRIGDALGEAPKTAPPTPADTRSDEEKKADEAREKARETQERIRQLRELAKQESERKKAEAELERIRKALEKGDLDEALKGPSASSEPEPKDPATVSLPSGPLSAHPGLEKIGEHPLIKFKLSTGSEIIGLSKDYKVNPDGTLTYKGSGDTVEYTVPYTVKGNRVKERAFGTKPAEVVAGGESILPVGRIESATVYGNVGVFQNRELTPQERDQQQLDEKLARIKLIKDRKEAERELKSLENDLREMERDDRASEAQWRARLRYLSRWKRNYW